MKKLGCIVGLILAAMAALVLFFGNQALGSATIEEETPFVIPSGYSLGAVAEKLEAEGLVSSADGFLLRARLFGSAEPIQAGEFALTADMGQSDILRAFQSGDVIRRFVTIPEGMPSVLVWEKLMGEELLTGEIEVPEEGSVLPDTYAFERDQDRGEIIAQMQVAMDEYLQQAWSERSENVVVDSIEDAVILASIVEKETGTPEERRTVAGLYSNRLRIGMRLQADPTIIYPITRGKPLGRRILRSEIDAVNDYNTYSMAGLPKGPITNPGRESIDAVLNPQPHDHLFMVADGTGGHAFAETLAEHNENVARWFEIRRERGEL